MAEQTNDPAVNEEPRNPSDIFNQRVAKVAELRAMGVDPFGQRYDDVESIEKARTLTP